MSDTTVMEWEYLAENPRTDPNESYDAFLERLGNQRWELVCFAADRFIFKRPVIRLGMDRSAIHAVDTNMLVCLACGSYEDRAPCSNCGNRLPARTSYR